MGSSQSHPHKTITERHLKRKHRELDESGELYKTIGFVWESKRALYAGSYLKASALRRDIAPSIYASAWRVSRNLKGAVDEIAYYRDIVPVISEVGGRTYEMEQWSFKSSRCDKSDSMMLTVRAHQRLRSITGFPNITKTYLLPEEPSSRYHWLPLLAILSGKRTLRRQAMYPGFDRELFAEILKCLCTNKLVLNSNRHIDSAYFGSLNQGSLVAIPLLDQGQMARWRPQEPYRMLVVCDSPETYRVLLGNSETPGADWATQGDLALATAILAESTKLLADSLLSNWEYHHGIAPRDRHYDQLVKLKSILQKERGVRVPRIKAGVTVEAKLHQRKPFDRRLKMLVIDFEKIYKHEVAKFIPDPWLLALKAANNWSTFAYSTDQEVLSMVPGDSLKGGL